MLSKLKQTTLYQCSSGRFMRYGLGLEVRRGADRRQARCRVVSGRWWQSPWGRVLKAIREDEVAASSLGKNLFSYRLQSFVIGSAIMGLGGALYASFVGYISPEDFLPIMTFQIWTMLIVGSSGNNKGAILGAVLMWAVWTLSGSAAQFLLPVDLQVKGGAAQIILIGLVLMLMLMLIFRPLGLIGEEATISHDARVEPHPKA